MVLATRLLGLLVLGFGLLGLVVTSAGRGLQMSVPELEGLPWTGSLRAGADDLVYALAAAAGLALLVRRFAVTATAAALALAALRFGFDLYAADRSTARGETILRGDLIAVLVLGLASVAALLAARNAKRAAP